MPGIHQISQYILNARKKKGLKQEVLGQLVGCTGSYITKLEKGVVLPSPILAMQLEKALRLKKNILTEIILEIKVREAGLRKQAISDARLGESRFTLSENTLVPLYHAASSNRWSEAIQKYVAIPNAEIAGREMFLLKVRDDCNDKSGIVKDDVLLVEICGGKHGEICVYCIGVDYFVKRYHHVDGNIRMSPNSSNDNHAITSHKNDSAIVWKGVVHAVYLKRID